MSDVHIASYILQVQPILFSQIKEHILAIGRVELPVCDEAQHKLIVVVEGCSTHDLEQQSEQLQQINGVITVTLVYHHAEAESELNQEMS